MVAKPVLDEAKIVTGEELLVMGNIGPCELIERGDKVMMCCQALP